jgi:cyclopropane fatty-acyl-phospholipid synthase-like methyltransferase
MDKKYWKKYYEDSNAPMQPSHFARFVMKEFLFENAKIIELGCGNGRDSLYFARHGTHVMAVDQVDANIESFVSKDGLKNLTYKCADFTKLNKVDPFDFVYSRFTLHSISEIEEDQVIKWSYDHLNKGGKILIEARGKNNELFKLGEPVKGEKNAYIYENHYRRFIDLKILIKKLVQTGFKIEIAEEKCGFAPFGDTDYIFIIIIATKK